jgi:hypothetical protein
LHATGVLGAQVLQDAFAADRASLYVGIGHTADVPVGDRCRTLEGKSDKTVPPA